jgi:hypothetical protein
MMTQLDFLMTLTLKLSALFMSMIFDRHGPPLPSRTLDSFEEAPYVIPLAGGAGSLMINDFGSAVPSASLVAVPEPTWLWTAGLCGTALLAGRRSSRRRRPRH